MKALSIKQPWAWLIAHGMKDIENRNWTTSYRGLILIHAGKEPDTGILRKNGYLNHYYLGMAPYWQEACRHMPERTADYEMGGIIGYATLKEVVTKSNSPWFRGHYGFVLTQRYTVPLIPLRGQLGLFDVPAEIEAQIHKICEQRIREQEKEQSSWQRSPMTARKCGRA